MPKGGARKGAGRPKGAASAKTRAIADGAALAGITPLEFLLDTLRDETLSFAARYSAAKDAAPYMHPRLSSVDAKVDATLGLRDWLVKSD